MILPFAMAGCAINRGNEDAVGDCVTTIPVLEVTVPVVVDDTAVSVFAAILITPSVARYLKVDISFI
jgi:hypothetical protein